MQSGKLSFRRSIATGALSSMFAVPVLSHAQTTKDAGSASDATAGAAKVASVRHLPRFGRHLENAGLAQPRRAKAMYFVKAMNDYKSGARKNEIMASMVRNVSDDDLKQIAAYYSSIAITVKAPKK
ncbi:MAG: cytochrome c class [Burkholderia sp.]|jgi:cytochrome c553|nr:cytochrome c class [Burkholderia sp.]